jgi:hypothetical protein
LELYIQAQDGSLRRQLLPGHNAQDGSRLLFTRQKAKVTLASELSYLFHLPHFQKSIRRYESYRALSKITEEMA